ncbi:MAG: hypothetical protein ACR2GH_06700 [Pseudonocardia sp.]
MTSDDVSLTRDWRGSIAAGPHLLAVAPSIAVLLAAADRLPDPIALHFDLFGTANGLFSSRWAAIALLAGLGVGLALLFGLYARQGSRLGSPVVVSSWDLGRWFIGLSWAMAGLLGGVLFGVVAANLDQPTATAAALPGWTFPLGLALAVVAGAVGALVAPRTPSTASEPGPTTPAVPLGATEQISWSRSVGSHWLLVLSAALLATGVVLGVTANAVAGAIVALAGALVLLLGSVAVTVDRRGLTLALGPLGWPRVRVPAEDVVSATVADVSPGQFGGWGYRIVPGARAVIIRSGPALVVTRRSGQRFVVTVDGATTAAGLLNGLAGTKR